MVGIDTMFFVIIGRGKANAILRKAQEYGATGGTIFLGEGTAQSKLLDAIGINEIQKELLMISSSNELSNKLHEILNNEFMFSKRNRGIAFTIPFKRCHLQADIQEQNTPIDGLNFKYCCIITIVDKGRSKACLEAARASGAKGGTIVHGHGAGIPTDYYFPLVIEPQKDILMILAAKEKAPSIRQKILIDLELDKAGNGIIFTLPVARVTGLFVEDPEESRGVVT